MKLREERRTVVIMSQPLHNVAVCLVNGIKQLLRIIFLGQEMSKEPHKKKHPHSIE